MHEGTFATLAPEECRALLRTREVGRVAWKSPVAGLLVLPVNYAVRDDLIVLRTSARSVLADLAEGRDVAFQVDDVDEETGNGWTVMVQGTSSAPGRGTAEALTQQGPVPWVVGEHDLVITLTIGEISGRMVDRPEK